MSGQVTCIKTAQWISRDQNVLVNFELYSTGQLVGKLYEKNKATQFQYTGITMYEQNMELEIENLAALCRGIKQKIFRLDMLNTTQKAALLGSIASRGIEIERWPNGMARMRIQALS